ncbi:MAG: ThiF family adenylyltransferase [bacterium]
MTPREPAALGLEEGRYARFEKIEWWQQERLQKARVLVVGAGALGNEVLKNFALLGLRHVVIVDMDCIEASNLTRSILFRASNQGMSKAECAAVMMQEICPEVHPIPMVGNILADIGLGIFRWADVVVGALDNREARVFVNAACAQVGKPWIDGGIEVLHGIVRGFNPPESSCYECTMSQADWQQINQRRSCSLLERRALANNGTPTTPTTASVIGAMQAQEVVKWLHGLETLQGKGYFFDGLSHDSYAVTYPINPECPWHEPPPEIEPLPQMTSETPLSVVAEYARQKLGGLDAIDLARELVRALACPTCGQTVPVWQSLENISAERAVCAHCGAEAAPVFLHAIEGGSELLEMTPRQLGLPRWDIVWARSGDLCLGLEISGDNPL